MGRAPRAGSVVLVAVLSGGAVGLAGCSGEGGTSAVRTVPTAPVLTAPPPATAPPPGAVAVPVPGAPGAVPEPAAAAPGVVPEPAAPAAGGGTSTAAAAPAAARPSPNVEVQQGDVGVTDLHVYRYGRELTVALRVDRASYASVAVFSRDGRPFGQGAARRPAGAGPLVTRVRLRRPQGRLRVVLSVIPSAGAGAPTVVSLTTRPRRAMVRVLSPRPGQVLRTDRVRVRLATSGFVISDQGTRPRPRQGHFHVTLDRRAYVASYDTELVFGGLADGPHVLRVVPTRNDHAPIPGLEPIGVRFRVKTGLAIRPQAASSRTYRLLPRPGMRTGLTPVLAWGRPPGARRYRLVLDDARSGRRVFARTTRARTLTVPAGRLRPGGVYVWRVTASGRRSSTVLGASWFRIG